MYKLQFYRNKELANIYTLYFNDKQILEFYNNIYLLDSITFLIYVVDINDKYNDLIDVSFYGIKYENIYRTNKIIFNKFNKYKSVKFSYMKQTNDINYRYII